MVAVVVVGQRQRLQMTTMMAGQHQGRTPDWVGSAGHQTLLASRHAMVVRERLPVAAFHRKLQGWMLAGLPLAAVAVRVLGVETAESALLLMVVVAVAVAKE